MWLFILGGTLYLLGAKMDTHSTSPLLSDESELDGIKSPYAVPEPRCPHIASLPQQGQEANPLPMLSQALPSDTQVQSSSCRLFLGTTTIQGGIPTTDQAPIVLDAV